MDTKQDISELGIRIYSFNGNVWDKTIIDSKNVKECYFIEDIFSYTLTGKLIFEDTTGILDTGGLVSGTSVWIFYGDGVVNNSDNPVNSSIEFKIYRINKITPNRADKFKNTSNNNIIELILVEPHFFNLIGQKYSKSWYDGDRGVSIPNIMENILTKMVGWDNSQILLDLDIISHKISGRDRMKFVMPYWTPLQALNWLNDRYAVSDTDGYGTLCYNTVSYENGEEVNHIKFDTLNKMLAQTVLLNDPGNGVFTLESGSPFDYNRILSYKIHGMDMFNNKQLRGGQVLGYNFEEKKLINELFQYSEFRTSGDKIEKYKEYFNNKSYSLADKITTLGNWTLLQSTNENIEDTETKIELTGESDPNVIRNLTINKWFKSYCMQNTLSIVVKGHESRHVGALINIKWPPTNSTTASYNQNLHGNYLIKSVTHHWSENNKPFYKQKLNLIKNAYNYDNITSDICYESNKKNVQTTSSVIGSS